MQVFGPDPHRNLLPGVAAQPSRGLAGHPDMDAVILGPQRAIGLAHPHGREIHRRRAEKTGDKPVRRFVVEFERLADLLHEPSRMTTTRSPKVIAST